MHGTSLASLVGKTPTRRAYTPLVTIYQPCKAELWVRSDQVVAMLPEKLQKLRGDLSADGMGAMIAIIGVATTIPKPPCQRIVRTTGKDAAKNIVRYVHLFFSRVIEC